MPPPAGSLTERYQHALALAKAGRRAEALDILHDLRAVRADVPEILFQIGRLEAVEGDRAKAEAALRAALKLRPKEPAIWQALHGVLSNAARSKLEREARRARVILGSRAEIDEILSRMERGQLVEAEADALQLVKAAPAAAWPAYALGQVRAVAENWAGALPPLEMAHQRAPGVAEIDIALGAVLARTGAVLRAEALLVPVAEGELTAARALARLYRDTMRPEDAADLLARWTQKRGKSLPLLRELALSAAACGRGEQASQALVRAADLSPSPVSLYAQVAGAFEEAGNVAMAERVVETGLARASKGREVLLTQRAQQLQSAGQLDAAEALLREALLLQPGYSEALRALAAAQKVTAEDPLTIEIDDALARPSMPPLDRSRLHFAAAKLSWDQRRDAEGADHLLRANRLMAKAHPYRFEADLAEARQLVADWAQLKGLTADAPDDPVLFVTGLPRSGTTLVETILAAHPEVAAGGEMPFLGRALSPALDALRDGAPKPDLFAQAGARYLSAARRRAGGTLFTDKAISTYSRIGHAARALPGARFVILRRDPRDVGLSMFRNMFREGMHRYTTDLEAMGRYIRLHEALVSFWADMLPDRVHVVEYEALTAEPEPQIRALVAFAGLDWNEACLAPERSTRRVQTLSFAQVRAPIGQQAVAGWQRYEAMLAPMIRAWEKTAIDLRIDG